MAKKLNPYILGAVSGKHLERFVTDGPLTESKYNDLKDMFTQMQSLYQKAMEAGPAPKTFEDLDNKVWD